MSGRGWGQRSDRPSWAKVQQKVNPGWSVPVTHEHHVVYDSLTSYVAARTSPVNASFDRHCGDHRGRDWLGVDTRAEVDQILARGVWPEGSRRLERELSGFDDVPPARSIKRRARWQDQGDELDIHRVNSGRLDTAWRRTTRAAVRASANVVIPFPLFITYKDNADRLFWACAAAIKLTDLLTVAGYNVTLLGTHSIKFNGQQTHLSLVAKEASAPLDVEALVAAIAFPGFSRVAGFRALTAIEHTIDTVQLGGGDFDSEVPMRRLGIPFQNRAHGLFSFVDSAETAREWVEWMLERIEGRSRTEDPFLPDDTPRVATSTEPPKAKPMTQREKRDLDRWWREEQASKRSM